MKLTWKDAEEIGLALREANPELDPLSVRFTDLRRWVVDLSDFADDPEKSNEAKLEAIQMAWYDAWQEALPK